MLDRLIALSVIIGLMAYEVIRSIVLLLNIKKNEEFASEYRNKLVGYCNKGEEQDYHWLVTNAVKMQDYMGSMGIASYKPSFANYYINNYLTIVNGLAEVRNERSLGFGNNDEARMMVDSVDMYYGNLNYLREQLLSSMKNPIKLITSSIRGILMLPFALFHEVGLYSSKVYEMIKNSIVVRIIAACASLVSILSALISVVIGWDAFVILVKGFIP